MSPKASQPNAHYSHRASVRAMWAIAALLAVSYAGDEHVVRPFAAGQDPAGQNAVASPPGEIAGGAAEPAAEKGPELTTALNTQTTTVVEGVPEGQTGEATQAPAKPEETAQPKAKIASKPPLETALATKADIDLRDVTLADWMTLIKQTWNVDLLYDPTELQVHRQSGSFTDETLENILKFLLPKFKLTYKKVGNALSIETQSEVGGINLQQVHEIITMEYNDPVQVEPTLTVLMSPSGISKSIPEAKSLMVIDLPENVENVKKHIAKLEQIVRGQKEKQLAEENRQTAERRAAEQSGVGQDGSPLPVVENIVNTTYRPKFVNAVDIQDAIAEQLVDGGTVTAIEAENRLVLSGTPSKLQSIAQLLRELDVPRRQVRISVMMYDISLEALEQLGFNWRNAGKNNISSTGVPNGLLDVHSAPMSFGGSSSSASTSTSTSSTSSSTGTGSTSSTPFGGFITSTTPNLVGSAFNFYHVGRHFDISAVVQALHQTDGARLLADPTVRCLDLETAEIRIVTEIPVQQLTQTDGGGSIGTTTFREAGILLNVTPEIADENWLRLTVAPEFSALSGFTSGGQPIINRRQASTKVLMMNGDTLVLGGMRQLNEVETVSGVPGLMNIKYLGNLFRSHRTNLTESELILFLRAEIVTTGCTMEPREHAAIQVAQERLDQFPFASHAPFIPSCNDPYCPYHNPPPRPSQTAPGEWAESGETIDAPSNPAMNKQYPAPLHGRQGRDITAPESAPSGSNNPEAFQTETGMETDPPPVMVDPAAKRHFVPNTNVAMRRLPAVGTENGPAQSPPVAKGIAEGNPAGARTSGSKIVAPTNPKERIAQSPVRRTSKTPASTTEPTEKKSGWFGEMFR